MRLIDVLHDRGGFLFRWRSYTPLLILPLVWLERGNFSYPLASHGWDLAFEAACLAIAWLGLLVRAKTIAHVPSGTSGRISRRLRAEALNTEGTYSVVRNPLYVGNYLIVLGLAAMTQCAELVAIVTLVFVLAYTPIVLAEEQFLAERFGREYGDYAARVPCFVPNLRRWRAPTTPFRWRMVLRREHDTWMATVVSFAALEYLREFTIVGQLGVDLLWNALLASTTCTWLVLKGLKRWTTVLAVPAISP